MIKYYLPMILLILTYYTKGQVDEPPYKDDIKSMKIFSTPWSNAIKGIDCNQLEGFFKTNNPSFVQIDLYYTYDFFRDVKTFIDTLDINKIL